MEKKLWELNKIKWSAKEESGNDSEDKGSPLTEYKMGQTNGEKIIAIE